MYRYIIPRSRRGNNIIYAPRRTRHRRRMYYNSVHIIMCNVQSECARKGFYIIHARRIWRSYRIIEFNNRVGGVDDCLNYGRFESNFERRLAVLHHRCSDRIYKWSIYVVILYI